DAPDRAPVAGPVDGADAEDVAARSERLRVAGRATVQRRAVERAAEAQRPTRREVVDRTELEGRPHSAHSGADDARRDRRLRVAEACEEKAGALPGRVGGAVRRGEVDASVEAAPLSVRRRRVEQDR